MLFKVYMIQRLATGDILTLSDVESRFFEVNNITIIPAWVIVLGRKII